MLTFSISDEVCVRVSDSHWSLIFYSEVIDFSSVSSVEELFHSIDGIVPMITVSEISQITDYYRIFTGTYNS